MERSFRSVWRWHRGATTSGGGKRLLGSEEKKKSKEVSQNPLQMPKGNESDSDWEGGDDKSSQDEHVAALGPALSERQLVLKQKAEEVTQPAVVPVKGRPGRKKREAEVDVMESCWECQQEDAKVNDTMVFCESCERG